MELRPVAKCPIDLLGVLRVVAWEQIRFERREESSRRIRELAKNRLAPDYHYLVLARNDCRGANHML